MNVHNEMTLTFESRSANEAFARTAAAAFLMQLDPTVGELSEIKTAVSEAVTNSIVHAYGNNIGIVRMNVRILDNNQVCIRIKDSGCGIPDIRAAMEPLFTTAPEEERAGLGFAVMENFCDSVSVRSRVGKGTTVTLRKTISPRVSDV